MSRAGAKQPGNEGPDAPERTPVGRVGRPHGLDGSFYVTRPRARMLTLGAKVTVAGRSTAIVRRAGTEQRPIVRLQGVDVGDGLRERAAVGEALAGQ